MTGTLRNAATRLPNARGTQPWLKMVNSFADDWNTQKRCEVIAQRLEMFRQDGLIALHYRPESKTDPQAIICAKTKISRDNCELLVTLKLGANGYESLKKMTEAVRNGTTVDQSSGRPAPPVFSPSSPQVNLQSLLANEDFKANSSVSK